MSLLLASCEKIQSYLPVKLIFAIVISLLLFLGRGSFSAIDCLIQDFWLKKEFQSIPDTEFQKLPELDEHGFVLSKSYDQRIIAILIDDASVLQMPEPPPWNRRIWADVIDFISRGNPKVIHFPAIFYSRSQKDPGQDYALVASVAKAGNLVLSLGISHNGQVISSFEELMKVSQSVPSRIDYHHWAMRGEQIVFPGSNGEPAPGAPLYLIHRLFDIPKENFDFKPDYVKVSFPAGTLSSETRLIRIPTYTNGNMLVNFSQLKNIFCVPLSSVFQKNVNPEIFKDKIVIIGPGVGGTMTGLAMISPLGFPVPESLVIGLSIKNILDGKFLHPPGEMQGFFLAVMILLVTLFFLVSNFALSFSILYVIGLAAVLLLSSFLLFTQANRVFEISAPLFSLVISFLFSVILQYHFEVVRSLRLYRESITDSLTNLFLRRYFEVCLKNEIGRAQRLKRNLAVLMIDIDNFKSINDTYGHQIGDLALKSIGETMKKLSRNYDIPARFGGEEFVVLLPETGREDASRVGERLRSVIAAQKIPLLEGSIQITISIGVACFPINASDPESLVKEADQALYCAKTGGKNQVRVSTRSIT